MRIADLERSIDAYALRRPAQGGTAARAAIARAQRLAGMVRDESTDTIGPYLDAMDLDQLYAIVVTLAAMVPLDTPVDELLGWLEPLGAELERDLERQRKARQAAAKATTREEAAA